MSSFVFKLNGAGVRQLLQGAEMQRILSDLANEKAAAAGTGYEAKVQVYSKRAVANIYPTTYEAAQDNYNNNTLVKAVL